MLDHHLGEVCRRRRQFGAATLARKRVQLVAEHILIRRNDAMGRQALHCERTGNAYARIINVRSIVKIFDVSISRDRLVDLLLTLDARRPPFGVQLLCSFRPSLVSFARNFPFLPWPVWAGLGRGSALTGAPKALI